MVSVLSNNEDSDSEEDDMPNLVERNNDDSESSFDEEEESNLIPHILVIDRKKRVPLKNTVVNDPMTIQEKLEMQYSP